MRPNDRSVLNGSGLHIRAAIQRLSRAKCAVVLACLLQSAAAAAPAEPQQVVFTIWRPGGDVIHEVLKDTPPPATPEVSDAREIPEAIFTPPPKSPRRLADLGMKGWVRLKFTITESGKVADAEVLDMHPRRYFARPALQTISKYRFAPPMLDGEPTPLTDVTVRMVFDPDR